MTGEIDWLVEIKCQMCGLYMVRSAEDGQTSPVFLFFNGQPQVNASMSNRYEGFLTYRLTCGWTNVGGSLRICQSKEYEELPKPLPLEHPKLQCLNLEPCARDMAGKITEMQQQCSRAKPKFDKSLST